MIRQMVLEDYEAVYQLWTNTKGMGMRSLDDSQEGIAKFLKRNPETNFVAIKDDHIVGVILSGHDGRRGYIYHMAVKEEMRGQGFGKNLLDKALEGLQNEGIHKAALVVFETNGIGNHFWEKHGFSSRKDLIYRNKSLNDSNL